MTRERFVMALRGRRRVDLGADWRDETDLDFIPSVVALRVGGVQSIVKDCEYF